MESALTSGIPLYQSPRSSDQLLSDFCSGNLVNEPGKVFGYNNAHYIVLGKIIEKIYAKTYEQAIVENILMPIQMKKTGLVHQDSMVQNLASRYFFRDDLNRLMPDLPVYIENWYAAGAMYSTAYDLLQFSNALFGLKLVNQESLDKMFESGLGEYGFGLWVYEDYEINKNMYTIMKRLGSTKGAQAMLFHILDTHT